MSASQPLPLVSCKAQAAARVEREVAVIAIGLQAISKDAQELRLTSALPFLTRVSVPPKRPLRTPTRSWKRQRRPLQGTHGHFGFLACAHRSLKLTQSAGIASPPGAWRTGRLRSSSRRRSLAVDAGLANISAVEARWRTARWTVGPVRIRAAGRPGNVARMIWRVCAACKSQANSGIWPTDHPSSFES